MSSAKYIRQKTEADAKKFYNDNKYRFGTATFDQVKMCPILALQQSEESQQIDRSSQNSAPL